MQKRILFLMSDTGGGHRASAKAIKEAIDHLHPHKYDIWIEDIWQHHTCWPFNAIPRTYSWLTGPGLPVWKAMWRVSHFPYVQRATFNFITPLIIPGVARYFRAVKPDLIVSVHPLMNHLGLKGLKQAGLDVPFITVVTDLVTIHPAWICPRVTHCIVPTEAARRHALKYGMPAAKLAVYGQPVSLKFAHLKADKQTLRRQLGLEPNRQTVLIVGGGEGFGQVGDIARQIARTVPQAQLVIVTGRNQILKAKLEATPWEIPIHLYGFVENMPELMRASDVLITKAGPGTISEAFIAGLPPVISGFIPGQESGNVAYVQDNQAGAYADTPDRIAEVVLDWLRPDNAILQQVTQNAARLARPQASLEIAMDLCQYV
ncbi:MAG TPA: glycosyltransferase [Anaerolineae bacterium]|nr:glycosyltransferase [Anaerolineae bacterium]